MDLNILFMITMILIIFDIIMVLMFEIKELRKKVSLHHDILTRTQDYLIEIAKGGEE